MLGKQRQGVDKSPEHCGRRVLILLTHKDTMHPFLCVVTKTLTGFILKGDVGAVAFGKIIYCSLQKRGSKMAGLT